MRLPSLFVGALLAMVAFALPAAAGRRVALVIGNGAYQSVAALPNPPRDAQAMAEMFRAAQFDDVRVEINSGLVSMRRALRAFADTAEEADIAVVFYAGHGIEISGHNYLVPVDAALATDIDVQDEAIELDRVLQMLEPVKSLKLVILDACRDNPFASRMKMMRTTRAVARGLAVPEMHASNTLVAYSAPAGAIALDGEGANSPFTTALLNTLTIPGLDIRLALGEVHDEVQTATKHKQEPFIYGALGGGNLPLVPEAAKAVTVPAAVATVQRSEFTAAMEAENIAAIDAYLAKYPTGPLAVIVRRERERQVADVMAQAAAAVAAAPPGPPPPATAPAAAAGAAFPAGSPVAALGTGSAAAPAPVGAWKLKATAFVGGGPVTGSVTRDFSTFALGGNRDGMVRLFDAASLKPGLQFHLNAYRNDTLDDIAFFPDQRQVAVQRYGEIEIFDLKSGRKLSELAKMRGFDHGYMKFSSDGRKLYWIRLNLAAQRSLVSVFALQFGTIHLEENYAFAGRIDSFDVTPDDAMFLLTTYPASQLMLYDPRKKAAVWSETCACSARLGVNGTAIVYAGRVEKPTNAPDAPVQVGVMALDRSQRATFAAGANDELAVLDVTPDGALAAIRFGSSGQVSIFPIIPGAADLQPLSVLNDHSRQNITAAAFVGSDGLVTASGDNNMRMWGR